jgi:hypothetical protein
VVNATEGLTGIREKGQPPSKGPCVDGSGLARFVAGRSGCVFGLFARCS